MKQKTTILVVILALAGICFFIAAKKETDNLLKRFKETERSIASIKDTADIKQRVENAQRIFPAAMLRSQIILLIDSLKDEYETLPEKAKAAEISKNKYPGINRLLSLIQGHNKLKWDAADSALPDTIPYWLETEKFNRQKWVQSNFDEPVKFEVITYLNYLRNKTLLSE